MTQRRVVVTGLGAVSPVGADVQATWDSIVNGVSGVTSLKDTRGPEFGTRVGATVDDFHAEAYLENKDIRRLDKFTQYGMAASIQAVESCGLHEAGYDPDRVGVIIGSGIGGITTIETACALRVDLSPKRVSPFFVPAIIVNIISGHLSIRYDFRGANLALATACTTSTHAIGLAARLIRWGEADAMVAGGAEAPLTPLVIAAFASMRALSSRDSDPPGASRPWDKGRDGFVLGEGAGTLVLEEYEHAKARNATIYSELIGFGMSGDAHHITSPTAEGTGFCTSMAKALKDAGIAPDDVGYINAHGTSTPLGDVAETLAIKRLFGNKTKVPVSSTKSVMGHLLGGAGAVEAVAAILAMRHGILPPTINLQDPDDQCDLDYVPNEARDGNIRIAMSNSFGFGGTNGTLLFRA